MTMKQRCIILGRDMGSAMSIWVVISKRTQKKPKISGAETCGAFCMG